MGELPPDRPAFGPAPAGLTIDDVPRNVKMFKLFENELDSISSPSGSIHWTFFGVTIGTAITLIVTLSTGTVPPDKVPIFTFSSWGASVLSLYFLAMGIRDQIRAHGLLKNIKKRPAQQ